MEQFITIASDSIENLRKSDVFRVLEQNSAEIRNDLAAFISNERPDLSDEVSECMADL